MNREIVSAILDGICDGGYGYVRILEMCKIYTKGIYAATIIFHDDGIMISRHQVSHNRFIDYLSYTPDRLCACIKEIMPNE